MTIDVPTAGQPILDSWGADVANQLNRMIPIALTADQSTNSGTAQDVTELAWAVTAGRVYHVQLFCGYKVSATNQGLQLGWSAPSSNGIMHGRMSGNGGVLGYTDFRSYDGSLTGRTSTDATGNREVWASFWYQCSTDGTFQIKFARGGTSGSTGVTLLAGGGGLVLEATP